MSNNTGIPPEQQDIRDKCFHPAGGYVEFSRSDLDQSVPNRFGQMVSAYPDRPALKHGHHQFTYAEMDVETNRLAQVILNELGEGQEAVSIMLGHDEKMVIAIFAVLKTGKFHAPLNPSHPHARNAFILEDSGARLIVTDNDHEPLVRRLAGDKIRVVNVDELRPDMPSDAPGLKISPDDFAYVLYTSGTTSEPKGVIENHRNVVHFSYIYNYVLHVCPDDRMGVLEAFNFSGSASNLYPPLLNGACALPFDPSGDGLNRLADFLMGEEVTFVGMGPSIFRGLVVNLDEDTVFPNLRVLAIGGDRVDIQDVEAYRKHCTPDCILRVGFGATEVKEIRWFLMDREFQLTTDFVPVGYELPDIEILVLDDDETPLDFDEPGEIAIRSRYISPGYWHRPDIDADKFRPDPEGVDKRIYLTGDTGRMSPDGCLFHLGRKDYQVKIRGYRVELAEIEIALQKLESVSQAAVVTHRGTDSGETRLAAYIVPEKQCKPTVTAIRHDLSVILPNYMIPSIYMFMDALPLNPNGKIDRKALPEPDRARPKLENPYTPPRTKLESFLAHVWQDALEIESIGIHDDFFELGGSSIRAMMILNQIHQHIGKFVPLAAIFDAPTVAEMSAYLRENYARPVSEFLGDRTAIEGRDQKPSTVPHEDRINESRAKHFREEIIAPLLSQITVAKEKNPPAVFLLAPPRSGTTLLRVMLAGHPGLFSPPELNMLFFNTLGERRQKLSGRQSFRLSGTIRAIMKLRECDFDRASEIMVRYENQDMHIQIFYGLLQEWADDRILVDKTPDYCRHIEVLRNVEKWFDGAYYIHLTRHPYGMIRSFEEARIDLTHVAENNCTSRELAELLWLNGHRSIRNFLAKIPADRRVRLSFEDVVTDPQPAMENICRLLKIPYHPDMLNPYDDSEKRMTDGVYSVTPMLGDMKFRTFRKIEPGVAYRWKTAYSHDFLGDVTWRMAELLGYQRPDDPDSLFISAEQSDMRRILDELEVMSDQEARRILKERETNTSS